MEIYNVFYYDEFVGNFLQASFSSIKEAEAYIKHNPNNREEGTLFIECCSFTDWYKRSLNEHLRIYER